MPMMLASVADLTELEDAIRLGADLVDLKDPAAGALGAWPRDRLREAVARTARRRPLSATVGDLPMSPAVIAAAAAGTAETGVEIVKVGFFAGGESNARESGACITALAPIAARGVRLVAVLMADQRPDLGLLPMLATAGFHGVMLDTADKRAGGLRAHRDEPSLARFVREARALGLLTGLAGSLRLDDIAPLAALGPNYLGFRGALCRDDRTGRLDPERFRTVRAALDRAASAHAA